MLQERTGRGSGSESSEKGHLSSQEPSQVLAVRPSSSLSVTLLVGTPLDRFLLQTGDGLQIGQVPRHPDASHLGAGRMPERKEGRGKEPLPETVCSALEREGGARERGEAGGSRWGPGEHPCGRASLPVLKH